MRYLIALSCLALSGCFQHNAASTTPQYSEEITRVVDGDTIEIKAAWNPYPGLEWKIRVLGIDTPEKGYLAKCPVERTRAAAASARTEALIAASNWHVVLTGMKQDKYGGRFDANVILSDGRSLGDVLVNEKLAKPYNGAGPKPNWCY